MPRKLHARDMKGADEFQQTTGRVVSRVLPHLERRWPVYAGVAAGLVVVLLLWTTVDWWLGRGELEAQNILGKALAAASDDGPSAAGDDAAASRGVRLVEARALLDTLVDEHGRTDAATIAAYYRASVALRQGEAEEAASMAAEFVDDHPRHDLAPEALMLLAAAREQAGDVAAAEGALQRLVDGEWDLFPRGAALVELGRFYERNDQPERAREIYERLTTDEEFSESPYSSAARQRLAAS